MMDVLNVRLIQAFNVLDHLLFVPPYVEMVLWSQDMRIVMMGSMEFLLLADLDV